MMINVLESTAAISSKNHKMQESTRQLTKVLKSSQPNVEINDFISS